MRAQSNISIAVVTAGLTLIFPTASYSGQETNAPSSNPVIQVTFVVRDTTGASIDQLTVELSGESQGGIIYTGIPRNKGDQWTFEVPSAGTYTAELGAPGYKRTRRLVSVADRDKNLRIDVTLEPDSHLGKANGISILAPKARAELDKGKHALSAKQFDEAKAHLEKALQLAPNSPEVNYYTGLLCYYRGDTNAAVDHFQKSISMDPGNGQPLLALGEVYYSQKDYAQASKVLEQGLTLQPNSWRAEAVLGNAFYKQADYERGREHAQKALTIGKGEASGVGLLLGKCLAALGRKQEAIAALQTLLKQQSTSDVTRAAQELLNKLQANP